jgi:hypothetical protein
MTHRVRAAAAAAALILFAVSHGVAPAAGAKLDDAARFLAGLPLAADSPLARLTRDPGWQQHARFFDAAWQRLDREQLSRIRVWSAENLKERRSPLFYMFSGPDFLYADAFYPEASTYVLAGLEQVGRIPEITDRTRSSLPNLRASLYTSLNLTFFITAHMRQQLNQGELTGTLPILYVFIARAGKSIREVELVGLDREGNLQPMERDPRRAAQQTPGVRIVFARGDGPAQTLYYFRTDLSDGGTRASGFLKFCDTLGMGNGLVKSASYLLHNSSFSRVRQFLLDRTQYLVQDDSGVPVAYFNADKWELFPFGRYLGPIPIFSGQFQPRLQHLFLKGKPGRIDFGIGYRSRPNESNLLLAVRKKAAQASQ